MATSPQRDPTDAASGERLQRVLADAGVASRRRAEALIREGAVEVNGRVITALPAFADPEIDRIVVDGKVVSAPQRPLYLMLNKPTRTLTTAEDEPGSQRRTVADLVQHPSEARVFPVGRLDYDTVGLLLLTNDGHLANTLTHPRYDVPKTYRAVVKGRIEPEDCAELEQGIYLAERREGRTVGARRTARVELDVVFQDRDKTVLDVTLREGKNRQVRRMLAAVGFPVKKLERIAMGPLKLSRVARGAWRELDRHEIRAIKEAARRVRAVAKRESKTGEVHDRVRPADAPRTVRNPSPSSERGADGDRTPSTRSTARGRAGSTNRPASRSTKKAVKSTGKNTVKNAGRQTTKKATKKATKKTAKKTGNRTTNKASQSRTPKPRAARGGSKRGARRPR